MSKECVEEAGAMILGHKSVLMVKTVPFFPYIYGYVIIMISGYMESKEEKISCTRPFPHYYSFNLYFLAIPMSLCLCLDSSSIECEWKSELSKEEGRVNP